MTRFEGYDLREMITNFWKSGKKNEGLSKMLLEDEIFLLGREEMHAQAIEKLISLKEYIMAEEYCSSKPNKNLLSALFSQYIKLYDASQGEEKKNMSKRIHLFLQSYSTHPELDPAEVLQNIPDDWYLSKGGFMSYLQAALSQTDFTRKSIKCKRQLTEMNLQNSNYKLVMAQKAWVKITEKEKCAVSGMKIGDKVFDVFPNGVLLMHSTLKSQNETICPITGQNFANTCNF